jgi:hypothetical protein
MNTPKQNSHKNAPRKLGLRSTSQNSQKFNSSFLLLGIMCLIVALLMANLAFGYSGGTGEPNNPYQIANVNDLLALSAEVNDYNKCFILINDINLSGQNFTTALIAPDINPSESGFQGTAFTGVFDGANHKITNLNIYVNENKDYIGLFGELNSGEVINLGLENVLIKIENPTYINFVGCLAAKSFAGNINNCYSTGSIADVTIGYSYNSAFGGLVGSIEYGDINNCYSTCAINGGRDTWYFGGLAGENYGGNIINCHATGNITARSRVYAGDYNVEIGGLVGITNNGFISDCYATGNITCGDVDIFNIGGLVGSNENLNSITRCYATGIVDGNGLSEELGGLVGDNRSNINKCFATGKVIGGHGLGGLVGGNSGNIEECFSTGFIEGRNDSWNIGGLTGRNINNGDINNCYSLGDINGGINSNRIGGFVGSNGGVDSGGIISHSYSTGIVNGGVQYKGGFAGDNYGSSEINSCYFLETSGPNNGFGEPLTDEQMKHCDNFEGWDFVYSGCNNGPDYIWFIFEGVNYPQLAWYMGICVVPDVAGLTMYDANDKIIERGFTVGTITYEYSYTVPAGSVISQNPAPGQQECGSTVSYVASKGAWPCIIPNVAGLTMSDANSLIIGSGFAVGDISYGYSDTVPAGYVISQNPAPGPSEECDLAISYIASLGPIPRNGRVPDYDEDGIVNFADFAIFADAWLAENSLIDLTGDNYVDIYDLKLFCDAWLKESF